jgi:hypothetical protein
MAKVSITRIPFHNAGNMPVEFLVGTSPNDYPEKVIVQPGETYMGFKNYTKFYKRKGLVEGASPTAEAIRQEAILASTEAAAMKAEAEKAKLEALEAKKEAEAVKAEAELAIAQANSAKAQAALEGADGETIDAGLLDPVDDDEPPATKPAKGRGKGKASK